MRILVDIDGVLCEQVQPALDRYNATHLTEFTKADIVTYNKPVGDTSIGSLIAMIDGDDRPPIPGAVNAMKALANNHYLVACTSRPGLMKIATEWWLNEHQIECQDVTFTDDKAGEAGDILIDDYTGHVNAFAATGRKAILFDQPWNRNDKLHPLVSRCHGWTEVLEQVKEWEVFHP